MSELDNVLTALNKRLVRAKLDAFQRWAFNTADGTHAYKLAVWKIKDLYRGKTCNLARGETSLDQPFPPDILAATGEAAAAVDSATDAAIRNMVLPLAATVDAPLTSAALQNGRHPQTREIDGVLSGFNIRLLETQLHHAERAGVGQLAAFASDVEAATENCQRKLDDIAARGVDVTAVRAEVAALASAVTSTAATAGSVEVPAAA